MSNIHHFYVEGMVCQRNCGTTVCNGLIGVPGAVDAGAVFDESRAWVATDAAYSVHEAAVEALEAVGFDATPCRFLALHVTGMMCQQNCGATVRAALAQALSRHYEVLHIQVSFERQRAVLLVKINDNSDEELLAVAVEAIEDVGFDARAWTPKDDINDYVEKQTENKLQAVDVEAPPVYSDTNSSFSLAIEGMSCAVCTGRVEAAIKSVPGVANVTVILSTQRAAVVAEPGNDEDCLADLADRCQAAVQQAGYTVPHIIWPHDTSLTVSAQQMAEARIRERSQWRSLFVGSAAALVPITLLQHLPPLRHSGNDTMSLGRMTAILLLATAVQIGTGWRFYAAAYRGWAHGRTLGMDFLIVMGTTASYVYSVLVYLLRLVVIHDKANLQPTFMTGVMLLTFVSMGKWLEAIAKGNTSLAIQSLMEMQPSTAARLTHSVSWDDITTVDWATLSTETVDADEIGPGDFVKVLPGERLPADGILVALSSASSGKGTEPQAFLDESSFSGEPFPVTKRRGDTVSGGTVNVSSVVLVIEVTAAGGDSLLAQIVRLVEDAQRHKAPIQVYADKVAAIFCPFVLALAAITLVFWLFVAQEERFFVALMSAISVVVVACPCALGLATPCAVLVGTGVAASHGLLIKGGDILEKMQSVDTVVLDKTGTLSSGKPSLSSVETFVAPDEPVMRNLPVERSQLVLWLASVAELNSEHPIGKAIADAGRAFWGDDVPQSSKGVSLRDFTAEAGQGVECIVESAAWGAYGIRVGKREFAKEPVNGKAWKDESVGDADVDTMRRRGEIAVYVSVWDVNSGAPRRVIGVLGVNDPIKPEARSTVQALHRMGIDVYMCTGDASTTALAVAERVGIAPDNVFAGVTPQGKGEIVSELRSQTKTRLRMPWFWKPSKRTVAMIADGVNDAVALAQADVGFAIACGTEVAVEAADVVLVKSHLHDVVVALHLSSVVFRRILFNLACAMVYNVCALPFAAGLFTPFTDFRLPPAAAGLMMAVSSVSVVTSSLLLKTYNKPTISEDGKFRKANEIKETSGRGVLIARHKYRGLPTQTSDLELV